MREPIKGVPSPRLLLHTRWLELVWWGCGIWAWGLDWKWGVVWIGPLTIFWGRWAHDVGEEGVMNYCGKVKAACCCIRVKGHEGDHCCDCAGSWDQQEGYPISFPYRAGLLTAAMAEARYAGQAVDVPVQKGRGIGMSTLGSVSVTLGLLGIITSCIVGNAAAAMWAAAYTSASMYAEFKR